MDLSEDMENYIGFLNYWRDQLRSVQIGMARCQSELMKKEAEGQSDFLHINASLNLQLEHIVDNLLFPPWSIRDYCKSTAINSVTVAESAAAPTT